MHAPDKSEPYLLPGRKLRDATAQRAAEFVRPHCGLVDQRRTAAQPAGDSTTERVGATMSASRTKACVARPSRVSRKKWRSIQGDSV